MGDEGRGWTRRNKAKKKQGIELGGELQRQERKSSRTARTVEPSVRRVLYRWRGEAQSVRDSYQFEQLLQS